MATVAQPMELLAVRRVGAGRATGGGPARATWFISIHIYQNSFVSFDMGYASALAWLFFIVLFVFTYMQFQLSRRWVYYAGERGR